MLLPQATILTLAAILVVVALTWLHHARVLAGRHPARRPLPALDTLRFALGRGAETGQAVHVSPGASTIGAADGSQARLVAVLDNLGKGASGAAVQNLNIMAGLPETAGLRL